MNFDAQGNIIDSQAFSGDAVRRFTATVFSWMFGALLVTAAVAYAFANSSLVYFLFNETTGKPTGLFWVAAFAPIVIPFIMGYGMERLSLPVMIGLFLLYSVLIGISLCSIFLFFEPMMLVKAFLMTAGVFGIMAIAGFTTKADLSKIGTVLIIGFFCVFAVSLLNFFVFHSEGMSWLIDIIFLVIFTGLIAYKMQLIRRYGETYGTSQPKLAVFMALSLYITFINLFITLLRLLNRR
jgi:hypothetical protein